MAVDHRWNLVLANDVAFSLVDGISDELLAEPINVMRLLFHPNGFRHRMLDYEAYGAHLLHRLHRQLRATGDDAIRRLIKECESYPGVVTTFGSTFPIAPILRMRLSDDGPTLSFFTIVSTLGTPYDVTLDEIAIESFFPADDATAQAIGMHASA